MYKLTFEDGSDGYLAHHGIKGMKWGVWNDETRARRMGYHELRGIAKKSKTWDEATSRIRSSIGDARSEQTKLNRKKMDEALDALNAYESKLKLNFGPEDHPVFAKAADKAAKDYIKKELAQNGKYYPEGSRDRLKLDEYAYFEVGFDAGRKAFDAKFPEYNKLESAWEKAYDNYTSSLNSDVSRLVKNNANRPLNVKIAGSNTMAKELVRSALDDIGKEERKH